jgi:hypothetical protein
MARVKKSMNRFVLSFALALSACGAHDDNTPSAPEPEPDPQTAVCLACCHFGGTIADEPEPPPEPECDPDKAEDGCECPAEGCVGLEPDFGLPR